MTRVGLVGYGMAGREIHAPLLTAAGLEVAVVSTGNPERAAAARAELPGVTVVPGLAEVLAEPGIDLVVLATPTGGHAREALQVIEAGIPLVVDKPLALDATEALEVVDAAAHAGVPLTVFQNRRFDVEFTSVRAALDGGAIGAVRRVEARWERWRPVPKQRWREQLPAEQGGGILLDLGPHLLDWVTSLLGPVSSVDATLTTLTTEAEDEAFLLCRHEGGGESHVGMSSLVGAPGPYLRVLGDAGALVLGDFNGEPVTWSDLAASSSAVAWVLRGAHEREPVARSGEGQVAFYEAVQAALGSADPQAAMPVNPRDAVHTMAVLDAARLSARSGTVVDVLTPGVRPD